LQLTFKYFFVDSEIHDGSAKTSFSARFDGDKLGARLQELGKQIANMATVRNFEFISNNINMEKTIYKYKLFRKIKYSIINEYKISVKLKF
jgi:hypothetical protein